MATSFRCPVCGRSSRPRHENRSFPFCGDRCRLLDLGKWFTEEYRIPGPLAGDGGVEGRPDLEGLEGDEEA